MPTPRADSLLMSGAAPMLAREVPALPHGEDWIYEFLWGGERVRAAKHDGGIQLLSRECKDVTNRFPRIAAAIAHLRPSEVILDGEILYLDTYAPPVVRFLSEAMDEPSSGGLIFVAYDLLCDEGRDIRQFSLLCRRLLLASTIQGTPIAISPLIDGQSNTALAASARLGFRGVVAKRAGSAYRPNSLSHDWVKLTFNAPVLRATLRRQTSFNPGGRRTVTRVIPPRWN